MATFVMIFSKELDTLADIIVQLNRLKIQNRWVEVCDWSIRGVNMLHRTDSCIVDTVDDAFAQRADTQELVEWLAAADRTYAPASLILAGNNAYKLRALRGRHWGSRMVIHDFGDPLTDDTLLGLTQWRSLIEHPSLVEA